MRTATAIVVLTLLSSALAAPVAERTFTQEQARSEVAALEARGTVGVFTKVILEGLAVGGGLTAVTALLDHFLSHKSRRSTELDGILSAEEQASLASLADEFRAAGIKRQEHVAADWLKGEPEMHQFLEPFGFFHPQASKRAVSNSNGHLELSHHEVGQLATFFHKVNALEEAYPSTVSSRDLGERGLGSIFGKLFAKLAGGVAEDTIGTVIKKAAVGGIASAVGSFAVGSILDKIFGTSSSSTSTTAAPAPTATATSSRRSVPEVTDEDVAQLSDFFKAVNAHNSGNSDLASRGLFPLGPVAKLVVGGLVSVGAASIAGTILDKVQNKLHLRDSDGFDLAEIAQFLHVPQASLEALD